MKKKQQASASGAQLRAARAILDLSAKQLSEETGLSRGTIQRAELETVPVTASNMARIVETLERLGVIFIPADGKGPGVRLRNPPDK
jgi:transcriptional regulator with XRE-family HTH domain